MTTLHQMAWTFRYAVLLMAILGSWACRSEGGSDGAAERQRDALTQSNIDWSDTSHFNDFPEFSDSALQATHEALMLLDTTAPDAAVSWLEANEIDTGAAGRHIFKVQDGDPDPYKHLLLPVDAEPELLNLPAVLEAVQIPADLKARLGPSRVLLKVLINTNGRPKDYFMYRSPDIRVTRALLDKIRFLKAKPAELKGQPVKCWVNLEYNLM